MYFKVFGPYNILGKEGKEDRGHQGWLDKEDFRGFWSRVDGSIDRRHGKLSQSCGVYLYGVLGKEGKRKPIGCTLPWYVGKAEKQTFDQECFNGRNQNEYNRVWSSVYRGLGTPFLYFLARMEDDQFSRPTTAQYRGIRFVEDLFIQMSLTVNSNLVNKQLTSHAQKTYIPGILNSALRGRRSNVINNFRNLLSVTNPIDIVAPKDREEIKFNYEIVGPYDVPVKNAKTIDFEGVHGLWKDVRKTQARDAYGVYIIAIRHGTNVRPWYVGTARSETFEDQCFKRNMDQVQKVIEKSGAPVIYFLPQMTATKNRRAKAPGRDTVRAANMNYVRAMLLRHGAQANREILSEDEQDNAMLRDLTVEGVINPSRGARRREVNCLRQLMNLGTSGIR